MGFERIIRLFNNASWDNDSFLWLVNHNFFEGKISNFCQSLPLIPFDIVIEITRLYEEDEEEIEKSEEKKIINASNSFKSDECVICLTEPPNVLFCNCGHIAICVECSKMKSLEECPICKTENIILRIIE